MHRDSNLQPQLAIPNAGGVNWLHSLRELSKNRAFLALLDQGIVSGTSFLTSILVGRAVGKELFGVFFIALGAYTIVQCVADQLIHTPYLVRAPGQKNSALRQYTGSALLHNATLTLASIGGLLNAAAVILFSSSGSTELWQALALLAVCLPGMLVRDFMHNFFHNRLRQLRAVFLDGAIALVQLSALALLYALEALTVNRALLVVGLSSGLMALAWYPSFAKNWLVARGRVVEDFVANWSIGQWALGSYLVGSSAPTVLPWLLAFFHGTDSTGFLAACMMLVGVAQTFLRGVGKYMAPRMAHTYVAHGPNALLKSILGFVGFTLAVMTVLSGGLAIWGENLVVFGYGDEFAGTGRIMFVLALGCWFQTLDVVVGNGILAMAQTQLNFWADCIRCIATLVATGVLIVSFGAMGVALALGIGIVVGLCARVVLLMRALNAAPSPENVVELGEGV